MKSSGIKLKIWICAASLILFSCKADESQTSGKEVQVVVTKEPFKKLKGLYEDTLNITLPAAVFFYPDTLQWQGFFAYDSSVAGSVAHEFENMMHVSHQSLIQFWPKVNVYECRQAKYLRIQNALQTDTMINLDTINDLWGLILFEKGKQPIPADMMNIDTVLEDYFVR